MSSNLFNWWLRQMGALLSPITNRFAVSTQKAMLVMRDADAPETIRLLRRGKRSLDCIGTFQINADPSTWLGALGTRGHREPIVLSLNETLLLRQTTLPLAAEANLTRVLGYEMGRLTPFSAQDVFFTHTEVSRNRAKGQLTVELALAPRLWVSDLLARLTDAGLHPSSIEAPGSDGIVRRIPLTRGNPAQTARARAMTRFGWAVCAAFAVAVLAMPLQRQSADLAQTRQQIAALRPRTDQAEVLRRQIAASLRGADQLAAARHRAAEALRAVALITDLMPNDTWLTGFALRQHRLTIEGQSAAATKLISALASRPGLKNPSFGAPLVRSEAGSDLFTIQTEVEF